MLVTLLLYLLAKICKVFHFINNPSIIFEGLFLFLRFLFRVYWFHEREVLTFSSGLVFEKCKESFSESESTGWWHTVFEHLDEVPFRHHRFIITSFQELLLCLEPGPLIERIIEFRKSISYFTSCDNRLESLDSTRIRRTSFCKRRDDLWMINEECWSSDLFSDVFPESICETFTILSFISDSEFLEFFSHLVIGRCEEIDASF